MFYLKPKPLLLIAMLLCSSVVGAQEFSWAGESDVIGEIKRTSSQPKDTLYDIGMAHDVGFNEMRNANPKMDAWLPANGSEVVIPSKFILPSIREGVVVNLREYRLYFFPEDGSKVITYPVGIGAEESPSPVVHTRVKLKIEQPNWYPPESVREEYFDEHGKKMDWVVYPGPENPLGPFAIQLDLPEYFIHGTNKPFGIGTKVSRGCIRMDNKDLAKFVWEVPKYAPVHFVKESVKVGLAGEELFVELHLDDETNADSDQIVDQVLKNVGSLEKTHGFMKIDFLALNLAIQHPSGLPQKIGVKKADLTQISFAGSSQ
jgi:L,D-transpeptidase ErfK/SrfK